LKSISKILITTLLILALSNFVYKSFGYIERKYTLQEVIESCTNIVFGKIESVDDKRLNVVIKVEEDVLGESGFEKIKINLAVGQRRPETSPEKMVQYFREGKPVVIFYDLHSGQLNSLGHVGGKWFQCKTYVGKEWEEKNWRDKWWSFTHIEVHMHNAYKGWTVNLQKKVREILKEMDVVLAGKPAPTFEEASKEHIKLLLLSNRNYATEFRTLRRFRQIGKYKFACERTYDTKLPEFEKASILWIGYRGLGEDRCLIDGNCENKIKKFVKNGGVVILSGQDNDIGSTKWFAGKLNAVECEVQIGIYPNQNADVLFQTPNKVKTEDIYTEDAWNGWGNHFEVLATTNDRRNIAIGRYKYGKGMYLITSLHHQTFFQVARSQHLMENLLYCAAKHLDSNGILGKAQKFIQYQHEEPEIKYAEKPQNKKAEKTKSQETKLTKNVVRKTEITEQEPLSSHNVRTEFHPSPSVLQQLEFGDVRTRQAAVERLADLGHTTALLKAVQDPEISVKKLAVQKMIELDYTQGLIIAMDQEETSIKTSCARNLARKFDIYGLKKVYNNPDENIRNIALEELRKNPVLTVNIISSFVDSGNSSISEFAQSVLENATGEKIDNFYEWREDKLENGIMMTCYQGLNFENQVIFQISPTIDLNSRTNLDDLGNSFSIRWVGYLLIPDSNVYLFKILHNALIRFWVDGEKIDSKCINNSKVKTNLKALYLEEGYHSLRLEYCCNSSEPKIQLLWNRDGKDSAIPKENLFHLKFDNDTSQIVYREN